MEVHVPTTKASGTETDDTDTYRFRVTAENTDAESFTETAPMQGFALDNLAPPKVKGTTGELNEDNIVVLQWDPANAHDLQEYLVVEEQAGEPLLDDPLVTSEESMAEFTFPGDRDHLRILVYARDIHNNLSAKGEILQLSSDGEVLNIDVTTTRAVDPGTSTVVEDENTGASVQIPQGALAEKTRIEMGTYDTVPGGADASGPVIHLGPSGTVFEEPVEIRVPYDPMMLPEGISREEDLVLLRFEETDRRWVELETTVDTDQKLLIGKTDHFSGFAAGILRASGTPPETFSASASVLFGDASKSQDYRLVALPGAGSTPLDEIAGGNHEVDWQAWWDDGSDSDYLVEYNGSDTFTLSPGNGFWLTGTEPLEYRESVTSVQLNELSQATIPLHEGWNIISNPLDIDVEWARIEQVNGGELQPAWGFDGAFSQATVLASAASGQAFYFLNDQGLEELRIPYVESGAAEKAKPVSSGTRLRLVLSVEDRPASVTTLVLADNEEAGKQSDVVAPPPVFEQASLRFVAGDNANRTSRQSRLSTIFRDRALASQGIRYAMTLAAEEGATVQVRAEGLENMDATHVVLLNPNTGRRYDLSGGKPAELTGTGSATELVLAVGNADYIDAQQQGMLPEQISVDQNYPNPFNPATTLRFALPAQSQVSVQVYDVLGRRVATLVDWIREAGIHTVRFDAQNQASGLYFAVFQIGDRRIIQKMTLIK
ncbi:MAG: T9SS type A sorting domain-containing protein [Balneolaceae bacterium]|nr:T9SS type A sorting domain-containing protein [Balneolaceae bacterium]